MRTAILAGGQGTRLANYFPDIPKPMIPLNGKPLLHWQIESLVSQGFTEITLIIGYKAGSIKTYFETGEKFGANITYITEENPLGTGGALVLLPREDTLILYGDVYCDVDFSMMINYHRKREASITLFSHPNNHPYDSDIVIVDEGNKVVSWAAKNNRIRGDLRNLVNAGIYVFSGNFLPKGAPIKKDLEKDIILPGLSTGTVFGYRSTEYVKDMGTPKRLKSVEEDIKRGITSARNLKNRQKAIFIDRDGTINKEEGFIRKPDQISLLPGAAEALKQINQSEYLAICITNQPVIARGEVSFEELNTIHARLDTLLAKEGAYLDDLLLCPHHPDTGFEGEWAEYKKNCDCRKPKPGLLLKAAKLYNVDLSQSYMIGDSTADTLAGQAAGCRTIRVKTGVAFTDGKYDAPPTMFCLDLPDAVEKILYTDELV